VSASPFIIAGLFDGPWVFVFIVLVSAVVNWLSKRRQEQAGGEDRRNEMSGGQPPKAPADWEERLRRLLGEEVVPPRPGPPPSSQSAPPLRRPTAPTPRPPILRPGGPTAPAWRPPPVEVVPVTVKTTRDEVVGHGVEETIRRFESLDSAAMTSVRPLGIMKPARGSMLGAALRQRQVAQQAFVASLVFGPPKGLEE
jgi:hypothetical protein